MSPGRPIRRLLGAWALAALVIALALPAMARVSAAITAVRFLTEFLTDGRRPWLTRATEPPSVEALPGGGPVGSPAPAIDLWLPGHDTLRPRPGLVLIHGLTPDGRRDARLAWTADRLARAGFAVAVPDLPGLRAQRMRPEDALVVRDTLLRLPAHPAVLDAPVTVLAVSVGLGPVALALRDPPIAARVRTLVTLGGYGDARELVRYFTTGAYAFGGARGQVPVDPILASAFLAQNLDLVGDPRDRADLADALRGRPPPADLSAGVRAVLALVQNREPGRVDALLDALPVETRELLDALSPIRHLGRARVRLLLVHGKGDPAIPFTESARLAAAAPDRARLVLVDLVGHVEGQAPAWRRLTDLVRLWSACYELLAD